MQLRDIEKGKTHCAREHFTAVSNYNVVYDLWTAISPCLIS